MNNFNQKITIFEKKSQIKIFQNFFDFSIYRRLILIIIKVLFMFQEIAHFRHVITTITDSDVEIEVDFWRDGEASEF